MNKASIQLVAEMIVSSLSCIFDYILQKSGFNTRTYTTRIFTW